MQTLMQSMMLVPYHNTGALGTEDKELPLDPGSTEYIDDTFMQRHLMKDRLLEAPVDLTDYIEQQDPCLRLGQAGYAPPGNINDVTRKEKQVLSPDAQAMMQADLESRRRFLLETEQKRRDRLRNQGVGFQTVRVVNLRYGADQVDPEVTMFVDAVIAEEVARQEAMLTRTVEVPERVAARKQYFGDLEGFMETHGIDSTDHFRRPLSGELRDNQVLAWFVRGVNLESPDMPTDYTPTGIPRQPPRKLFYYTQVSTGAVNKIANQPARYQEAYKLGFRIAFARELGDFLAANDAPVTQRDYEGVLDFMSRTQEGRARRKYEAEKEQERRDGKLYRALVDGDEEIRQSLIEMGFVLPDSGIKTLEDLDQNDLYRLGRHLNAGNKNASNRLISQITRNGLVPHAQPPAQTPAQAPGGGLFIPGYQAPSRPNKIVIPDTVDVKHYS